MVRTHDTRRSPHAAPLCSPARGWILRGLALALLTSLLASSAQARVETVRWTQGDLTDIVGWKIYVGLSSRNYVDTIDVGFPVPDGEGIYSFDIEVADDATLYIAMRSYGANDDHSALSNETVKSPSGTPPPPPPDGEPAAAYRLNAGGPSTLAVGSEIWSADDPYVDGGTPSTSVRSIAGTQLDALYHTKRWGGSEGDPLTYALPVESGLHRVRLHFVETYEPNFAVGQRLFHVDVEGNRVLRNYDIFATVGANTAAVEEFEVNVSDGMLTIDLVRVGGQTPTIAAIEVDQSSGVPLTPPKAPILIPHD